MNGDTAELLKAITESISNGIKPLKDDISAIRTAVQDRGERLSKIEERTENADCGKNTEKIDEASRGVTSNRYFIFILVITALGALVTTLIRGL